MRKIVVFYAWQSDALPRNNKYLIAALLKKAAEQITADPSMDAEVLVDSDTQGVLGQPPVSDTILRKIENCDIFAPDFTYVGQTPAGKLLPNPNVMLEYGYALRVKGHGAMLAIMNTAHGPAEKLPFDMGHLRHPIQFTLPDEATAAERRTARASLFAEIEKVMRAMVKARITESRRENPFAETPTIGGSRFFYAPGIALANFGEPGEQEYKPPTGPAAYLRVFPRYGDQPKVGRAKVGQIFIDRKPCPMTLSLGGAAVENDFGAIILDPSGSRIADAFTQGFPTGELWGVNSRIFRQPPVPEALAGRQQQYPTLPAIGLEKIYVRNLPNYMRVIIREMGLKGPFAVEMGLVGVKNWYLGVPSSQYANGQLGGPIRDDFFSETYELDDENPAAIKRILREFFIEVYDRASVVRADVLTDAFIEASDLPPR